MSSGLHALHTNETLEMEDGGTRLRQLSDLDASAQLVIWSLRRWLSGKRNWNLVRYEYTKRLGEEAGHELFIAFVRLLSALAQNACRQLHCHAPCCPFVTKDEILLTRVVAAGQSGNMLIARHYAHGLVSRWAVDTLIMRAWIYSQLLSACFENTGPGWEVSKARTPRLV